MKPSRDVRARHAHRHLSPTCFIGADVMQETRHLFTQTCAQGINYGRFDRMKVPRKGGQDANNVILTDYVSVLQYCRVVTYNNISLCH